MWRINAEADDGYRLYPNPGNGMLSLELKLQADTKLRLTVYDLEGRLLRDLQLGQKKAGHHVQALDLRGLSAGIYFYRLAMNGKYHSGKADYQIRLEGNCTEKIVFFFPYDSSIVS